MTRKFFTILLALMLVIQGAALAKKKAVELPESERIRIGVEVVDNTNFPNLDTSAILRDALINQINAKKIFSVVNASGNLDGLKTLGEMAGASDVGDFVVFSPAKSFEIDRSFYRRLDARYVLRCEILGIGVAQGDPDTFDLSPGIGVGLETDESFGVGVGIFGGAASKLRNFYNVAVTLNLVDMDSGQLVLRNNLTGRSIKRKKPSKGYDNASDEAYFKAIKKTAEVVTNRLGEYATRNLNVGK